MKLAVVGGGISGLAAAFRGRAGAILYEASPRLGGVIRTERRGAYLMEAGPDSFLDKPPMRDLSRELGIERQLIQVRPEARRSFIVRGRRLLPIPEGVYLMVPSALWPFLRSPAVSWPGKARMLADLVVPRRSVADETLGSFVRRRLGGEALERLAQPLLGGIYGADPERLSLEATMPQFLAMERRHGSVIRGLLGRSERASGARYGMFLTFRDGMQTLVDALASRLGDARLGTRVSALADVGGDAVCLAAPPPEAARLAPELPFPAVSYSSVATINFGFQRSQVRHPLDGAGFVVPAVEGRTLMACTFSSSKFESRAPAGRVLLRAFAGGMLQPDVYSLPDTELISRCLAELAELLGISGEPEEVWLNRWPDSMPQYEPGHLDRVATLEQALPPNLALAGNAYRGVGIPDCVASGFAAAERLATYAA
jgi:oxygen-dependent protoporphyrinogen oxidase